MPADWQSQDELRRLREIAEEQVQLQQEMAWRQDDILRQQEAEIQERRAQAAADRWKQHLAEFESALPPDERAFSRQLLGGFEQANAQLARDRVVLAARARRARWLGALVYGVAAWTAVHELGRFGIGPLAPRPDLEARLSTELAQSLTRRLEPLWRGHSPARATKGGFDLFARTFFPGGTYTRRTAQGDVLSYTCSTAAPKYAGSPPQAAIEAEGTVTLTPANGRARTGHRRFDAAFVFSAAGLPLDWPVFGDNQWTCTGGQSSEEGDVDDGPLEGAALCRALFLTCNGGAIDASAVELKPKEGSEALQIAVASEYPPSARTVGNVKYLCEVGDPRLDGRRGVAPATIYCEDAASGARKARFEAVLKAPDWECAGGRFVGTERCGFADVCTALHTACGEAK